MYKKIILLTFLSLALLMPDRNVQAQTDTPQPAVLPPTAAILPSQTSVKTIVTGINDYMDRLVMIHQKIGTRINKLNKAKVKTTELSTKYNNLNRQLQLLKTEVNKTQSASTKFLSSSNPQKDYLLFRNQLLSAKSILNSFFLTEKDIVTEMKKYNIISATPTGGK